MKIISKPDITTWTCKFTCYTCKSELQADYTDLKFRMERKYHGGGYGDEGYYANEHIYYLTCPICGKETHLNPTQKGTEIPYLLQEKVKKDCNESNKKVRY